MELSGYADLAVRLVNTEEPGPGGDTLTTVDDVRALCEPYPQLVRRTAEGDVARLRAARTRLRAVFTAASESDDVRAVDLLNALLVEFPVSPRISGHGPPDAGGRPRRHLHLHPADQSGSAAAGYTAMACTGLAAHLTASGADRLGICGAGPCRNAYLDTSANRSRRYCSDRCATRAHVAAHRARRRREATEPRDVRPGPTNGRTAPSAQPTTAGTDR